MLEACMCRTRFPVRSATSTEKYLTFETPQKQRQVTSYAPEYVAMVGDTVSSSNEKKDHWELFPHDGILSIRTKTYITVPGTRRRHVEQNASYGRHGVCTGTAIPEEVPYAATFSRNRRDRGILRRVHPVSYHITAVLQDWVDLTSS